MFEFSRFYSSDYEHGRDFVTDLDKFLAALGIIAALISARSGGELHIQ